MIVADQLVKRYGPRLAVDRVSFRVESGRVVAVLGPNGAGKTSTIRMLVGALVPTAGRASVGGVDVARDPLGARRLIGYLPESTPLHDEMRTDAYLRFRAELAGVPRARRAAAVDRAVEACALGSVRRRPIRHLSKGFRQRVGLAGALVHEPPVLVLDEPTVGLDPRQIVEIRTLVRSLAGGRTVLLSTHILSEAESACDEAILIDGGRVRATGTLASLRRAAATEQRVRAWTDDAAGRQAVAAALPEATCAVRGRDGDWVELEVVAPRDAADLAERVGRALLANGRRLRGLESREPTLEEAFVALVRRSDDATRADDGGQAA